jgi:hypothetical protein
MAFLDRLHKIAVAAGGATKAVIGFTLGLPAASFKKDEYDSFIGDIYGNIVASGRDIATSTLGPQSPAGLAIGGQAEGIRHPVRSVTEPITAGLETGYREAIAEPISAFFTTVAIADEFGKFSPAQAYRIAQHRSPGQALAVAFDGINPLDEAEVTKFIGTDKGRMISGMADAVLRVGADPTVILGKAAKAVRVAKITKPLDTPEKIVAAVNSPKTAQFSEAIIAFKTANPKAAAAQIRDRFFPDHDAGALISTIYGEAKTPEQVHFATRALLGDPEALAILKSQRSVLHEQIASLNRSADQLGPIKAMQETNFNGTIVDPMHVRGTVGDGGIQGTLFGVDANGIPLDVAAIRDELTQYDAWDARLSRMQKGFQTIRTAPRSRLIDKVPAIGEVRTAVTRSDFYQNTTLGRNLESIFHMNSHPVMNLSNPKSDINIHRMMQEGHLPQDLQDAFRTEYMAAPDDATRLRVAMSAEKTTIAHLAAQAKMSPEELTDIVNKLYESRGQAQEMLKNRIFNDDGSSVLTHQDVNGQWVETYFPPSVTQEATLLPLVNMREIERMTTRLGQLRAHNPAIGIPREIAEGFTRIWKPAVLLRPAWPLRVVSDEQFRIIAKIGALSHMNNLYTGVKDYGSDFISSTRSVGIKNVAGRDNRAIRQSFGVRAYSTHDLDMEGVFGTPDDVHRKFRDLASSERSWQGFIGDTERHELREFRMAGETFKSVKPDADDYPALYNWAVDHLATQPIAKRLLAGDSVEDVIKFLHSTPEGSDILRANTLKSHNARNWVEEIEREIDRYTTGNPELRDLIRDRKATHDDLARLVPDTHLRPVAHGEALRQATNTGYTMRRIAEITERTFDKLGRLPTDVFSRNPFMGHMYRAEIDRQLTILGDTPIDNVLKAQIEERARNFALNETEKLLYDLAESSRFGEMLGFLSPFYNAWQEVITRWTGLAIENPVFAARARLIWRAPEKMGLVTDENGNEIASGEVYSDNEADPNYRGKDRILHIPLPDWVTDIPGMKRALGPKQEIAFNKKSFNLVLQGFPSAGPVATIPLNMIVKDRPELTDNAFVEKMLPFGPTHDTLDMIFPSSVKYFLSAKDQDEKYANTLMRIYNDRIVEWELGNRQGPRPTYAAAKKEADAFTLLRGISAMVAPAAPIWQSPYQFQIDSFRQAQARYGQWLSRRQQGFNEPNPLADEHGIDRTPDEWFLDEHGKEYFALTQAVSRTMNGVPPTLEAWNASKENAELIKEFPELGGLIVGAEGGGSFNSAVYNAQKNTPLSPGSGKNQREAIPWDEASIDPDRRLGWIEYRRFMDLIEAERIQRGLPNLQVKGAAELASIKSAFTDNLKDKYPAWADDFNQTDKGKWEKKIKALTTIAADPRMADRPDMQGIREYMKARAGMEALLEDRGSKKNGSKTLSASSNADLKEMWDLTTGLLISRNLPFADVFYRHLENDPLGL